MHQESEFLHIATLAAKKAGEIIRFYFDKGVDFEQKKDKTFASIADNEAERAIREIILKKFPHHAFVGEEEGMVGNGKTIWHVDPLDGTSNFKNKIAYCCVSIGVEQEGKFIFGLIYNPFSDELFHAEEGKGAYLNGKKIGVNTQPLTEGVMVIDASFSGKSAAIKVGLQHELLHLTSRFRMTGSNAMQLAELAKGTYTSSLSDVINSYDFAAGVVIATEAGAIVTDQHGNKPTANSKVLIASNAQSTHDLLLPLVRKYYSQITL